MFCVQRTKNSLKLNFMLKSWFRVMVVVGEAAKKAWTAVTSVALSEEDKALAELEHYVQRQYSTIVPVEAEMYCICYFSLLVLLRQEMSNEPIPPHQRFVPITSNYFSLNGQFHRLSQWEQGLQRARAARNTPRKGIRKQLSEICCFHGKIVLHSLKG